MRLLECAKIVTTHGIKGEVKIQIITDDLRRFEKGNVLYLNEKETIQVDSFREFKNMGLLMFNGITDINEVLPYVGKTIYVDTEDDEEVYIDDLIGCTIYDYEKEVGIVTDVMEVPQGLILCVELFSKKEVLIPYVDEFVKIISLDEKKIYIESIEGLL